MYLLHNVSTKVTRYQTVCQIIKQRQFIKHFSVACGNDTQKTSSKNGRLQNFDELIDQRRKEAQRSVLVQVNSEKSFPELHTYCSQFGNIKTAHHYRLNAEDELHYILLEYSNINEKEAAINSSAYNDDFYGVPVQSPFLWFRAGSKKSQLKALGNDVNLVRENATCPIQEDNLQELMLSAVSMDDQVKILHGATHLNDTGIRLRFLAARQVEQSICGMFPRAKAYPFGSSVNGFGKVGCDLDLILRLDSEDDRKRPESRLVFHTKENLSNGRTQTQRQMESIGDMLQLFLPGVCNVRRILQARVPIIKYRHEHLDLEVDLSMSNMSGVYMSELLFIFGQMDERVRPLTFCIRRWAQIVGLTNASPGRWISNFSLTCLVIFFLQRLPQPILPSMQLLTDTATIDDKRISEDQINCTFARDLNRLQFQTTNGSGLSELLLQFFEFYSQFDFGNRGISLNSANHILKPDHSPIYIVNPLESSLNVSKNVSIEECERLRIEVRNAAWILDSTDGAKKDDTPWGVANIFKSGKHSLVRPQMFFKPRMFEVSDLFSEEDELMKGSSNKKQSVFKNDTIKSHVSSIEKKGKRDMKQMKMESSFGPTVARTRRR